MTSASLAAQAVSRPWWRWSDGMGWVAQHPGPVTFGRLALGERPPEGAVPDLGDDATLGLLGRVRGLLGGLAHMAPFVDRTATGWRWVADPAIPRDVAAMRGPTRAHALVAALDAAWGAA